MFSQAIYDTIMNNDEAWFIYGDNYAILLYDLPIYDC